MEEIVAVLNKIERHLAIVAEYVEYLHVQATGEKVYEVQGYVLGHTSAGEPCVHLYSTHPGLEYKVTTVYVERLNELPISLDLEGKTWDSDAAPSRETAARKGYLRLAPQPFRITVVPTGGTTDAGKPRYKLGRVLVAGAENAAPPPAEPPVKAPPTNPPAKASSAPPAQPQAALSAKPPVSPSPTALEAEFENLPRAAEAVAPPPPPPEGIDAHILAEVRALAALAPYASRRQPAEKETLALWISLVAETLRRFNCATRDAEPYAWAITRRLAGVEQPTEGWTPTAGQVQAWLDWISVKHEGRPIHPRRVSRRAADQIARLWAAVQEADKPKF